MVRPILIRRIIVLWWALQYLTITRPDLFFAANTISQFLQAHMVEHFQAVKLAHPSLCPRNLAFQAHFQVSLAKWPSLQRLFAQESSKP